MTSRITDSAAVSRFRACAQEFCREIDERACTDAAVLLRRVQPLLPALMSAALDLPSIERPGEFDDPREHHPRWKALYDALGEQLAPFTYYWEIFDPYREEQPIHGSLADDLAGIYFDLESGLHYWDSSDASTRRAIVWEWSFSYESHWGHHLIDAMRAIHSLLNVHRIEHSQDVHTEWPPQA